MTSGDPIPGKLTPTVSAHFLPDGRVSCPGFGASPFPYPVWGPEGLELQLELEPVLLDAGRSFAAACAAEGVAAPTCFAMLAERAVFRPGRLETGAVKRFAPSAEKWHRDICPERPPDQGGRRVRRLPEHRPAGSEPQRRTLSPGTPLELRRCERSIRDRPTRPLRKFFTRR